MIQGGKIEGTELIITPALATLERQHNKYIANLSIWDQYIVWSYTLGSQAINRKLAGIPYAPKNQQEWCFNFFNNFKQYGGSENVDNMYDEFLPLFDNPKMFKLLPFKLRQQITELMIEVYYEDLQNIIMNAPRTTGDIIVYKASTPYDPRLLNDQFPITLEQKPFNSTTYDPWFDFNAFLGSNTDTCCLWEIFIPKDSNCLAIAHPFQAYLTEREIVLPFGCALNVTGATQVAMSFYTDRDAPIRTQGRDMSTIGEVYRHDNWVDRPKAIRNMRMLLADYINPE